MAIETRGTQVEQLTARVRGPVVVPGDAIGRSCTVVAHLMQSDLLLPEEERRAAIAEVHLRIPQNAGWKRHVASMSQTVSRDGPAR
jgi:hypothetical protein